ncbi:DUF6171 family protein [Paenibacillus taichungensis]|uniref:DUF6171 family protein n=1 Tax=Paenibacillus taichungensis TaxID=484184 RepID=UPI00287759F6|nr:DUF6171 family protein [Paenibacillus taichungensis]
MDSSVQSRSAAKREPCKGCNDQYDVKISEAKIALLVELASRSRPAVEDTEYERRLSICADCPGLQYGTTCRYCGCLVQVRAKLVESTCPFPYEPRWT